MCSVTWSGRPFSLTGHSMRGMLGETAFTAVTEGFAWLYTPIALNFYHCNEPLKTVKFIFHRESVITL